MKSKSKLPSQPKTRRGENTKARLLEAARNLFFYGDYFSVSVDDIVKDARLRRATFYLHYSNKEEILVEIMKEEAKKLDPLYRWFETHSTTGENLRKFISLAIRLSKRARAQVRLFHLASSYDPVILKTRSDNRNRHVATLGESLPAFRDMNRGRAVEQRRSCEVLLFFFQLEQLVVHANFSGEKAEIAELINALAKSLGAFIAAYSTEGQCG